MFIFVSPLLTCAGNLDVLAKPSGTRDLLRRGLVRSLAFRLVHELNVASECMPTHLVASLMLMYRQGKIAAIYIFPAHALS
jgi:hypothetical protein